MKKLLGIAVSILLVPALCPGISGTVSAAGMGSANYRITAYSMNGGGSAPMVTQGGNGSFILGTSQAQSPAIGEATSASYNGPYGFWYRTASLVPDTDGDGIPDNVDTDDDNDGLLDIYETGTGIYQSPTDTGTDPLNPDTDGDTYTDGQEVSLISDPNIAASVPEFGTGDIAPHGAPDGLVDVADAMLALRIATGQVAPTPLDLARADVAPLSTPDGTIDIADALLIMRKATGLTSF